MNERVRGRGGGKRARDDMYRSGEKESKRWVGGREEKSENEGGKRRRCVIKWTLMRGDMYRQVWGKEKKCVCDGALMFKKLT